MEKIFYNGIILTMEPESPPEAVLVRGGVITQTGCLAVLRGLAPGAEEIDMAGRTMLPAFLDAHGHFSSYANAQLQLPLEGTKSFAELEACILAFLQSADIKKGDWIVATGYDHNALAEKSHPDRAFLDRLAPVNPLILQHQSGHCGVLNSKALALLGITRETESPSGGVIGRAAGELTGYLEENAYISCVKRVPPADGKALLAAYGKAQKKYFSYGITTVQEGMMVAQMLPLYQLLLENKLLSLDVVGYPDCNCMEEFVRTFPEAFKQYDRHFKIGGYKIVLDGSPQMKTAWMKLPYRGEDSYCGYGAMDDVDVFSAVERAAEEGIQILAHCNGDAAVQQFIDAVRHVAAKNPHILEQKPVIIHSQLITKEQLEEAAALCMIPSFFVAHVLHWGDVHIENFGFERACVISPARTALSCSVTFTFHQDAPVIEPNMLETIQCAVMRRTRAGMILGEDERISVMEALKAVTINAAYQYSEEDLKGSIKAGKQADFVILSDNPLTVPTDQIEKISVLETICRGETVFRSKLISNG